MEEAEGYHALMEQHGMTQEQAAQAVGKSRPAVANALRLLALPDEVRSFVTSGALSAGHARAILSLSGEKMQKTAAQKIVALRLSVRQAEAMCRSMVAKKLEKPEESSGKTNGPVTVDYVAECEKTLTRHLGRKVKIVSGKRKGRIELEFYNSDDQQALYEALLRLEKQT